MTKLTYSQIREEYLANRFPFSTRQYQLNLFGVRHRNTVADDFDDIIGFAWIDGDGKPQIYLCPATTDPGAHYLANPVNPAGTAILVPGFYQDMYKPGMHRGQYRALVQVNPCKYVRDNNKDNRLDFYQQRIYTGLIGLNLHRALRQGRATKVGPHSAGCQVLQLARDLNHLLTQVDIQHGHTRSNFVSYALFFEPEMVTLQEAA